MSKNTTAQAAKAALTTLVTETKDTPQRDIVTAVADIVGAALDAMEQRIDNLEALIIGQQRMAEEQRIACDKRVAVLEDLVAQLLKVKK